MKKLLSLMTFASLLALGGCCETEAPETTKSEPLVINNALTDALAPVAQPARIGFTAEYRYTGCYAQSILHLPGIVCRVQPHGHALRHKAQVVRCTAFRKIERPC